jgi:epidermal growth factor receptor substrate 15
VKRRRHLSLTAMTSFTPSSAELALVTQIISKADSQKLDLLTGDAALKVFEGAKLPPTVLREIWSIADEGNNGWLAHRGVAIAVRLMGWAQKGETVTKALVNKRECICILTVGIR